MNQVEIKMKAEQSLMRGKANIIVIGNKQGIFVAPAWSLDGKKAEMMFNHIQLRFTLESSEDDFYMVFDHDSNCELTIEEIFNKLQPFAEAKKE